MAINIADIEAVVNSLTPADDAPLSNKMRDNMAKRLGNEWKRFARDTDLFNEPLIESIEMEERTVYERCHKMLRTWEQKSPAKVTVAMAKLKLAEMGRNDLLLDIFSQPPPLPERSMASASSSGSAFTSQSLPANEPTVSNLKFNHVAKLSSFLDPDHGVAIRNWQQLGNTIFQGDKDAMDHIESLHLSYSGGGSPAKGFLKGLSMRKPQFTVSQFIDLANKHQRRDISTYLVNLNLPPTQQFRELKIQQLDKVARDLDKNIRGIRDWRDFADTLGFSNDEIAEFKLALKEKNQYSPTQSLIDLMKMRYPLLGLTKLKLAASSIGRNDVAQYLGSVIEELARR